MPQRNPEFTEQASKAVLRAIYELTPTLKFDWEYLRPTAIMWAAKFDKPVPRCKWY